METWKSIKGYEGLYEVSNLGRVRSLDRMVMMVNKGVLCKSLRHGRILNPCLVGDGYCNVNLFKNGKGKHHLVHRLVATAFIPNPENLPEINHKDENKTNNVVSNIEWCSSQYNGSYGNRPNKYKVKINQFDLNGNLMKQFDSVAEVAKEIGCHYTSISHAVKDKKPFKGFYFEKYNESNE